MVFHRFALRELSDVIHCVADSTRSNMSKLQRTALTLEWLKRTRIVCVECQASLAIRKHVHTLTI